MTCQEMPASAPLAESGRLMRILAEPTRLQVLDYLRGGEMNVTALCKLLSLAQPTVSHHLGVLREQGLVTHRRDGKQIFYAINHDIVQGGENGDAMHIVAGAVELCVGRFTPNGE